MCALPLLWALIIKNMALLRIWHNSLYLLKPLLPFWVFDNCQRINFQFSHKCFKWQKVPICLPSRIRFLGLTPPPSPAPSENSGSTQKFLLNFGWQNPPPLSWKSSLYLQNDVQFNENSSCLYWCELLKTFNSQSMWPTCCYKKHLNEFK